MNAEIAKQWATALPKYKQERDVLRKGDAFCCLGVLCNLHAIAHPEIAAQQPPDKYLGRSDFLPYAVQRWAGMRSCNGKLPSAVPPASLSIANDRGFNFAQIARLIKEYAEEL